MRLIQISDTHLAEGCDAFDANFDAVARYIAQAKPDLVVHSGDITRDAPFAPQELAYAKARLDALGAPVLAIPGNHDIGDNPGDGGYQPKKPVTEAQIDAYRAVFGADYWVEDRGAWRFIGLNSLYVLSGLEGEDAQWAWLEEAMTGHDQIGLFLHKPLFLLPEDTPADPPYRYLPEAARARLSALIDQHPVRFVGCGHVHQTRSHAVGQTQFVWAPATAFVLPDDMQPRVGDKLCGLIQYDLSDDGGVAFEIVTPEGIAHQDITTLPKVY